MAEKTGLKYDKLDQELQDRIIADKKMNVQNNYRCDNFDVIRRDNNSDIQNLWRPAFVRDTEKIMHLPYYNRYADKTQVFSFYHNDDITRRALHVQLVSRIARNIGSVLGLNLDLIEAIALGHDIGHTPFGHAGERFLDEILQLETDRFFNHNVQSARVLDKIFARNISLQTLDGILCHNGEFAVQEYRPSKNKSFEVFDQNVEKCYLEGVKANEHLIPATLEGCVVRICDMIAYLGKDRQDARIAKIIDKDTKFSGGKMGIENAAIINNLTVDIIQNSYGKDYILLSPQAFEGIITAKKENSEIIYKNKKVDNEYTQFIKPMFTDIYYKLLADVKQNNTFSIVYKHHIDFVGRNLKYYKNVDYAKEEPNQIVVDYIASMTDDYFIALYKKLFPNKTSTIEYKSYFEDID